MSTANIARLFALAALWGASFLFLRIGAATLPPALLMFIRVAVAAAFLVVVALVLGQGRSPRALFSWRAVRPYFVVGVLNSALPFVLIAFAARQLEAGTLATLNASSPAFGVVVASVVDRKAPSWSVLAGIALGIAGVAAVTLAVDSIRAAPLAIAASLGAALSYGIAAVVAKKRTSTSISSGSSSSSPSSSPNDAARGSMLAATVVLIVPALLSTSPAALVDVPLTTWLSVLALGVACTGAAYILYFRLIAEAGAAAALSVTFLVPIFAVAWGALFLDEQLRASTFIGGALVLLGTALTTGTLRSIKRFVRLA